MKIEHIAVWVNDLELMREFYQDNFGAQSNELYHNPIKNFKSYFLSFESGPRIELMHNPSITAKASSEIIGLAHFALAVGSKERVEEMTESLRQKGVVVVGEPRVTGDGYYESVVVDPEGNKIEITI